MWVLTPKELRNVLLGTARSGDYPPPRDREQAADNLIRTRVDDDLELDVSLHAPNQIFAICESSRGESSAVQHRASRGVEHLDGLAALGGIPIKGVECNSMIGAVRQVHIDREAAPNKPCSGDAVARVLGRLQGRQGSGRKTPMYSSIAR